MLNRDVYLNDPLQNKLANNGVAEVKDDQSQAALETLAYELRTFVCDGAYERGMAQILGSFLSNVQTANEQPGVWISGFFGSGKSHLAKMLRTLWVNQTFPDGRDARGMTELPAKIGRYFEELSAQAPRFGGLHAASGTFGEGLKGLVRPALLGIIFRSVGLPEQYHLARFVMWLKSRNIYGSVKQYVETHTDTPGANAWKDELRDLHVSPLIAKAVFDAMPGLASNSSMISEKLLAQFPSVEDVTNTEMVDALMSALAVDGQLPLTLIVIDEVQQYLGDDPQRAMDVQEAIETCCKASALKSRVLFVATGQSALSGKQNLQRLMGRFQVNVQLEDTDVDAVIRKVILQKKESARPQLEQVVQDNLGEISRHLRGSRIEYHRDDEQWMVADYPLLPVRRRFWERILQVLDKTGTGSQLRNQLRIVHEATKITAEQPLGHVVPADFVYEQNAVNLMNTGVIGRDIYENISRLKGGNAEQHLQGRLLSLILLINKLPNDIEHGIAATADTLADLLLDDLQASSHDLRTRIPALLKQLEDDRLVLSMQTRVGEEYRLQTAESQLWYDMYRQQMNELRANPQRLDAFRAQEIQNHVRKHVTQARITQGRHVAEARVVNLVFGSELPADADKKIYAWVPDDSEQQFLASARGADPESATIFIYVPTAFRTELNTAIVELKAAETTLEVRGVPGTDAGKEARSAMEHRLKEAERSKKAYLKDIFAQIQVKLAGGADVPGETLTQQVEAAAQTAAERLYREFYSVDVPGWGTVYNRASKEGGENALEAIGHQEEAAKHPVVIAIKRYVGVMKTGKEIRDNFKQAPYGWPQDTIDGALYAMLAAGILKGADAQEKPVDAKNLDRGKVGLTKFRPETVVISTVQLIKVRSLINALGVSCTAGEEASKLPQAVAAAKQAARSAGGDAPLPPAPNPALLNELEVLAGNSQLQLAYEHKDQLQADFESWKTQAEQIHPRKVQWSLLGDAMQHCKGLVIYAQLDTERHAILQNRSLLANPNPVEPLIKQAMTAIREAITAHLDNYEQEYHACMHDLDAYGTWAKLDSAQQQTLLKQHHLDDIPVEKLSGNEAVLESIERISLQQWNDRTAALPGRFEYVRKAAVSALQPKVQHVRVERATLENEQQLQAWLKATEVQLRAELNKGPVAIS